MADFDIMPYYEFSYLVSDVVEILKEKRDAENKQNKEQERQKKISKSKMKRPK